MKPTPPSPLFHGSTAASEKPVATAASTALPPAARIFAPTSPATRFCVATMPPRLCATGLRTCQFWTRCSSIESAFQQHPREKPRAEREVSHVHRFVGVVAAAGVADENHGGGIARVREVLRVVSRAARHLQRR